MAPRLTLRKPLPEEWYRTPVIPSPVSILSWEDLVTLVLHIRVEFAVSLEAMNDRMLERMYPWYSIMSVGP